MARTLTRNNLTATITQYMKDLATLEVPALPTDSIQLFTTLKRGRVEGGPYPGLSLFEIANRVMSDIVVLASAERILLDGFPSLPNDQPTSIDIRLGTEDGWDLDGSLGNGRRFVGECFNVAPTFFATKMGKTLRGLKKAEDTSHRVVTFNRDASNDYAKYERKCSSEWSYLLIDVCEFLSRWRT